VNGIFPDPFYLEYAYRQGLEDSQMIHNELSKYGISVAKDGVNNE